jgi:geranylgeranyl pyrophosphate synthase
VTRAEIPGLEAPDAQLERGLRARLDQVEQYLEKMIRADYDLLTDASAYLLQAGGKRFRPMLVLLSGYFGDPTDARLVPGAAAIELTHVATLYHDDVIDEAEYRHGVPSVNAKWSNSVAIVSGDFLFARAADIASELGTEVTRLLARTIATVCDGQIRDVTNAGRLDQSLDSYMETIRRKTAALMATSCRLGGMLSDAQPEHVEVLERFGEALGLGFQLSDDIMDVVSSERELGKEPAVDLRLGVYTLPVLHAIHHGSRREELSELLSARPLEDDALERAIEIVRSDGSLDHARAAVTVEVQKAKQLASILPEGVARTALESLADFIAARCGATE